MGSIKYSRLLLPEGRMSNHNFTREGTDATHLSWLHSIWGCARELTTGTDFQGNNFQLRTDNWIIGYARQLVRPWTTSTRSSVLPLLTTCGISISSWNKMIVQFYWKKSQSGAAVEILLLQAAINAPPLTSNDHFIFKRHEPLCGFPTTELIFWCWVDHLCTGLKCG